MGYDQVGTVIDRLDFCRWYKPYRLQMPRLFQCRADLSKNLNLRMTCSPSIHHASEAVKWQLCADR